MYQFPIHRTILPLVLAQLLIQFQKPIITEKAADVNVTAFNNSDSVQINDPFMNRNRRSVPAYDDPLHDQSPNGKFNIYTKFIVWHDNELNV